MKNQKNNKKFNPIVMEKFYYNFNDGLVDLTELCSYLNELFINMNKNPKEITEKDTKQLLTDDFADHIPEYGNTNTQFYSLMCTFNKISYKLPVFCTVGWTIIVDRETKEKTYKFSFSILSNKLKNEVYNDMVNNGWVETNR